MVETFIHFLQWLFSGTYRSALKAADAKDDADQEPGSQSGTAGTTATPVPVRASSDTASASPTVGPLQLSSVVDGWLQSQEFVVVKRPITAKRLGGVCTPQAIGWHTTDMSYGTEEALLKAWAKDPPARVAGAHFLVAYDGTVYQLAPLDRNASHMGGPTPGKFQDDRGKWNSLNATTIGVEVANPGRLYWADANLSIAREGSKAKPGKVIPRDRVEPNPKGIPYATFSVAQIEACRNLAVALGETVLRGRVSKSVSIKRVVDPLKRAVFLERDPLALRHSDVDPERKSDPGPLFPAEEIASHVRRTVRL